MYKKSTVILTSLFRVHLVWILALNLVFVEIISFKILAQAQFNQTPDEQNNILIFENSKDSVVYVSNTQLRRDFFSLDVLEVPSGTGTGFIWDQNGTIVTNYHVIEGANQIIVRLSDLSEHKAKVLGLAPERDVAVIKIDIPKSKSTPFKLGFSSKLKVGNKVLAIGNPFGLDQTLTTGIVSALGRQIRSPANRIVEGVIQTDAAINPGNSGGPLINSSGELVGMTTAIVSSSGSSAGIGFAIPVDSLKKTVPQLLAYGRIIRPILGVRFVKNALARRYNIDGAVVYGVIKNSSAQKAGIIGITQARDGTIYLGDVIIAIDDKTIKNTDDIYLLLDRYKVGDKVTVTTKRKSKTLKFEITLTASQ